jgi:hypothetical protein
MLVAVLPMPKITSAPFLGPLLDAYVGWIVVSAWVMVFPEPLLSVHDDTLPLETVTLAASSASSQSRSPPICVGEVSNDFTSILASGIGRLTRKEHAGDLPAGPVRQRGHSRATPPVRARLL